MLLFNFVVMWIALCGTVTSITLFDSGDGYVFKLMVTQDVWLENSSNKNNWQFLIVGKHPSYNKKRSLIQFETITEKYCPVKRLRWAKMYVYFEYAHKASWQSILAAPYISRPLQVHRVLKSWDEAVATTTLRTTGASWGSPWVGIDDIDAEEIPQWPNATIFTARPKGFVELDVTRAVSSWLVGEPNYGLLMWALNENQDGRDIRFLSKESDDATQHAFVNVMCEYEGDEESSDEYFEERPDW